MRLFATIFAALLLIAATGCSRNKEGNNYQDVSANDPAMNAAIAKARATTNDFVKAFHAPTPQMKDFLVKKPYPTPNGEQEHMWIVVSEEKDGVLRGMVANEAEATREVTNGQPVTLKLSEISDWKYTDGKKLVGGYTIRYFYDRMTPEEKQEFLKESGVEM